MTAQDFLDACLIVGFVCLIIGFILSVYRLVSGPTLVDRILALDMLSFLGMGMICLLTIATGIISYLDVAISLSLIIFLATVAFARYLQRRGMQAADRREEVDGRDQDGAPAGLAAPDAGGQRT